MKRKALKRSVARERSSNMVFTLGYLRDAKNEERITLSPVFFGDTRYPTDDIAHCGLFLDPPLSLDHLSEATLDVFYAGKDPIGRGHIKIALGGKADTYECVELQETFFYHVFKTHTLQLTIDQKSVACIEITLQNAQLMAMDNTPLLALVQDVTHWFTVNFGDRFIGQPYYPANPAVMEALAGLPEGIRSQDVPQRTPYWFKLRGIVTGSKAYKLCGFFPTNRAFTRDDLKRMRFGRLKEDYVCGVYLQNTPQNVKVQALGLVPYTERPGWGASPDGLIIDDEMTWDHPDIPEWTRADYENHPNVDITRGALEIKCSQANCLMRDYYYPQVYLEMMSLGAAWADVVRYNEYKMSDGNGTWSTKRECRIYRVYRHKPTEDQILECIITSLNTPENRRKALWKTKAFVSLRNYLEDLAANLRYRKVPASEELYNSYHSYFELPTIEESMIEDESPQHHDKRTRLNDVEERQLDIFRLYEREDAPSKEFVGLLIDQVKDLLGMLEDKAKL